MNRRTPQKDKRPDNSWKTLMYRGGAASRRREIGKDDHLHCHRWNVRRNRRGGVVTTATDLDHNMAETQDDLEPLGRDALLARVQELEATLTETNERLRSLLSLTHDLVCCIGFEPPIPTNLPASEQAAMMLSGQVMDCNETFARVYAYPSRQAVVGERFMKLAGVDDEDMLQRARRFVQSGYQVTEVPNTESLRDGSQRHLVNSSRGEIHNGHVVCVWILGRDVTMQRLIEAADEDGTPGLCRAAENLDSAFWVLNWTRFEMLYIGSAVEQRWGISKTVIECDPLGWLNVVHPADRQRARDSFLIHAATGAFDETFRIMLPDGTIRWIRDQAIPLPGHADGDLRVVGLAQDVTRSLEVESTLTSLFQFSREMLFVLDARGTIQECSTAMQDWLGFSRNEIIPREWVRMLHPTDQTAAREQLSRLCSGHAAVDVRCRICKSDESVCWIEWNAAPAGEHGLIHCVARDASADVNQESLDAKRNQAAALIDRLAPRERQIIQMVADGKPSKVIAHELSLSRRTVEKHRSNLMKKMNVQSVADVVRLSLQSRE
jgi:PAS domain S-box-containing protein